MGGLSEAIVFDFESQRHKFVKNVSKDSSLGYDIEIKNENGDVVKRIEVKTEGINSSFIITANEIQKSQELDNYYIYVVKNPESNKPIIKQLKPYDILNTMTCESLNYRLYF